MAKQLSNQTIINIYEEVMAGNSIDTVAKKYGVSYATVRRIKNKEYSKYKDIIDEYQKNQKNQKNKKVEKKQTLKLQGSEKVKKSSEEIKMVLLKLLEPVYQPFMLKYIYDNIINHKAFEGFINSISDKEISIKEFNEYILKAFVLVLNTTLSDKTSELILSNLDNLNIEKLNEKE